MQVYPMVSKIDCIRLSIPDLHSGLAFYQDKLGFQVLWRSDTSIGLGMPDTDTELVLHTEEAAMEVDFLVASADQAATQFESAGGKIIEGPFDIAVGRCVVVQDPWGNEYILLDLSKGPLQTDIHGVVIK